MTLAARVGRKHRERREPALEMPLEHRSLANAPEMAGPDASGERSAAVAEQRVDRRLRDASRAARRPRPRATAAVSLRSTPCDTAATSTRRPSRLSGTCAQAWTARATACRAGSSVRSPGIPVADGNRGPEQLRGRRRDPVEPFRLVVHLDDERQAGQDEWAKMMDPDVELGIARGLEAGFDHRVPRGVGVLHEEVEVAVRACQRVLVVLRDLGALHQHDRAVDRCERALEHERRDQRRRGRSARRGDGVQRGRPADACDRVAPRAGRRRESAGRTRAGRARSDGRRSPRGMRRTRSHCYSAL